MFGKDDLHQPIKSLTTTGPCSESSPLRRGTTTASSASLIMWRLSWWPWLVYVTNKRGERTQPRVFGRKQNTVCLHLLRPHCQDVHPTSRSGRRRYCECSAKVTGLDADQSREEVNKNGAGRGTWLPQDASNHASFMWILFWRFAPCQALHTPCGYSFAFRLHLILSTSPPHFVLGLTWFAFISACHPVLLLLPLLP